MVDMAMDMVDIQRVEPLALSKVHIVIAITVNVKKDMFIVVAMDMEVMVRHTFTLCTS